MGIKSKPSNVSNLLAAIQRKTPSASEPQTKFVKPELIRTKGSKRVPVQKSRVGKPVQFWLHDEDRQMVRELAAWLAGQGLRPTDSMIIRSALRMTKTGGNLLEAYRQASQLDGRLKQHKVNQAAGISIE